MCKTLFSNVIAVTNRTLCERPLLEQIHRVCQAHPRAIILREKDLSQEAYGELAGQVATICQQYQIPCILHFYPEVAKVLGIRNIHLPLWKLREMKEALDCTPWQRLGCSIHSLEEAIEAQQLGATYLTAGHIYTTDCKQGVPPRGLAFLQEICDNVQIPVYAIGGIHLDKDSGLPEQRQMDEVTACGAVGACIMSGMMRM